MAPPGARCRYLMDHEVDAMDLEPLRSGLEDEREFALAALVGERALAEMLRDGMLRFDVTRPEPFAAFAKCIEILSVYLPEYVSGIEILEALDAAGRRRSVACWRHIGRSGELARVALDHAVSVGREIVPGGEDVAALRAGWKDLPRWARDAFKLTYPELRDLDSRG